MRFSRSLDSLPPFSLPPTLMLIHVTFKCALVNRDIIYINSQFASDVNVCVKVRSIHITKLLRTFLKILTRNSEELEAIRNWSYLLLVSIAVAEAPQRGANDPCDVGGH